ncbi:MAG: uracil-DNA glycosylase family protein [Candidatus Ornithospirochaeta sp.]
MDDNRTLEYFLSLLDDTERVIDGDCLGEERDFFSYSLSDKEQPKAESVVFDKDLSSCHDCRECFTRSVYAEPILNMNPKILFVSPMPEGNTIFSDSSRDYFMKWMSAIGLRRSDIALTCLIKCPARTFSKEAADKCRNNLKEEMVKLKPLSMVLLGKDVASYMLRRSGDYDSVFRGKKFSVNSIPVFCTYTPYELTQNRSLRAPIWQDLQFISSSLNLGGGK